VLFDRCVCGPSVDPALSQFAADVEWLTPAGVEVHRFGLVSEPGRFAENPVVGALLKERGDAALPAVLVEGEVRSFGRYPTRLELAEWTGVATERPSLPLVAPSDPAGGCGCAPGEC
jgi:Arsenical resistance operon protein ArsD